MQTIDWPKVRETLQAAMTEAGLSQRALAEQAGVQQASLSRFLAGKTGSLELSTLTAIGNALGRNLWLTTENAASDPSAPNPFLTMIPLATIKPSPLNPRKTFDDASIDELAESIAARGLLQNLVVTRSALTEVATTTVYELVAGERRYRALQRLVKRGDLPADHAVPCRIVDAFDDAEHTALAIVENLQREQVSALEEAEAFVLLRKMDWTTEQIAGAIKRSRRHVQLRLALVDNLAEPARKALTEGKITLAHARVLATVPETLQKEGLSELTGHGYSNVKTAEQLKKHVLRDMVPAGKALLPPPDDCPGLTTIDDELFFESRAAFLAWQTQAVERRKAMLEDQWAWVDQLTPHEWHLETQIHKGWFDHPPRYQTDDDGRFIIRDAEKGGGAVLVFDSYNGDATVHTGLLREPTLLDDVEGERADAEADRAAAAKRELAERQAETARAKQFEGALQQAATTDPLLAFRLFAWNVFAGWNEVGPSLEWEDDDFGQDGLRPVSVSLAALYDPEEGQWRDPLAAWNEIARLPAAALTGLVRQLVARALWVRPGDLSAPVTQAIAKEFSIALGPDAEAPAQAEAAE